MLDLTHSLTGTDFSESSKGGVREALRIAGGDPTRKVTVVHVTKDIRDRDGLIARMQAWIETLPEYSQLTDPNQVSLDLEIGRITTGLGRCAKRVGARLIIVGPLPKTFMERWLTGGVAEQLFHATRIPVLATRAPVTGGYKHILVPTDFSGGAGRALDMAIELARDTTGASAAGAHLELLHVATMPGGVRTTAAGKSLMAQVTADFEAELKALAVEKNIEDLVEKSTVVIGVVQDAIPAEVHSCGADIVCMATGAGGLIGSTVDAVLRNVRIPLLVLPHTP